jgi:YVTN family beta-propeller protein
MSERLSGLIDLFLPFVRGKGLLYTGVGLFMVGMASFGWAGTPSATAPTEPSHAHGTHHVVQENVAVEFSLTQPALPDRSSDGAVAGDGAIATLHLRDAQTGEPLIGLHPRAWMALRRSEMVANETTCTDKVKSFLGGTLSTRADIDLNSYLMLVMNHDKTISVINPQIAMSRTKLESMIQLPGTGADWVLSQNKDFLYVTLPDQSSVAVVNTVTRRVVNVLATGEQGQPRRIALQPDGRFVWVGLDQAPFVALIDTTTNKMVTTIPVGNGLHQITFTTDGQFALVTNSSDDSVSLIAVSTRLKVAEVKLGHTPIAAAYSPMSRFFYVSALNGNEISVIDPEQRRIVASIPSQSGVVSLRFEPQGRFGLAVNQLQHTVSVLDTENHTIMASTSVVKEPYEVGFTPQYAYIRGLASEKLSLIELSKLRKGRLVSAEVQVGQSAANVLPDEIGVADMMVPTPEGHGMLVANAPDRTIYYYMEGMMVPMGTFQTYKRTPRALMLLDRSLAETAPGVYSTAVRLSKGGRYDVPVLLDHPRVISCFQVDVKEATKETITSLRPSLVVEPLFGENTLSLGRDSVLRFRITDSKTKEPITNLLDVQTLILEPPGVWQQRKWAKEADAGTYEIRQHFPRAGQYTVMVRIPSQGVQFDSHTRTTVTVVNGASPTQSVRNEKGKPAVPSR